VELWQENRLGVKQLKRLRSIPLIGGTLRYAARTFCKNGENCETWLVPQSDLVLKAEENSVVCTKSIRSDHGTNRTLVRHLLTQAAMELCNRSLNLRKGLPGNDRRPWQ